MRYYPRSLYHARFSASEALKLLKESGLDIPFIIVSGSIREDIPVAAMKAGANDYLMKNNLVRYPKALYSGNLNK